MPAIAHSTRGERRWVRGRGVERGCGAERGPAHMFARLAAAVRLIQFQRAEGTVHGNDSLSSSLAPRPIRGEVRRRSSECSAWTHSPPHTGLQATCCPSKVRSTTADLEQILISCMTTAHTVPDPAPCLSLVSTSSTMSLVLWQSRACVMATGRILLSSGMPLRRRTLLNWGEHATVGRSHDAWRSLATGLPAP